jgi:pentatricopeptide repeat protein
LDKPLFDLSRKLYQLQHQCNQGLQSKDADEEFWIALKDVMRKYRNAEDTKVLLEDNRFRKYLSYWVKRTSDRWLEATFRPDHVAPDRNLHHHTPSEEGLTPFQALKSRVYIERYLGLNLPRTIWSIAKATAEYHSTHSGPRQPHPAVIEGLRELMRIWHLSMAVNLCGQSSAGTSDYASKLAGVLNAPALDWSFLPELRAFIETLQLRAHHRDTRTSLMDVLEMLIASSFRRIGSWKQSLPDESFDFESSAIVTLGLLQQIKSLPRGGDTVKDYEPWMQLIELSLKNVTTPHVPKAIADRMVELSDGDARRNFYYSLIQKMDLDPVSSADGGAIQKAFAERAVDESTREQGQAPLGSSEDAPLTDIPKPAVPDENASHADRFTYLSIKRFGRAVQERNLRAAEWVRQNMRDFKSRNPDVRIQRALYEHAIYSFLCLRSIHTAAQLWEEMVKEGYKPRLKSYTTMMHGSQHLQDLTSMEYFWNKMREAKIQPDPTAWSTRIAGLFGRGHTEAGLRALSEMGQNWVLAAKQVYIREVSAGQKRNKMAAEVTAAQLLTRFEGDVDGVPRPNVVIMNSAIAPLSRGPDHLIPKVLGWGRSFCIEPDQITYNSLLHVSTKHGQGEEALKIIQRMRDRNIPVDSNTWNIILADMLVGGFLDGLSAEEQEAKVFDFLSIVDTDEKTGLDLKGYALLIDRLLKNYENHPAAQAVLSHMISKGMEPSTHIYTILMDSHLQQTPPNFLAADALWEHIQSAKGGYGATLDSKFFDLVIKGYAPHHTTVGTEKILSFLDRMDKEGKRPSWSALEATARALAETSEWARLAQIVDRTRRRLREERGIDTGAGQWSFWQFIISTGMLKHERITMPEQIMGMA